MIIFPNKCYFEKNEDVSISIIKNDIERAVLFRFSHFDEILHENKINIPIGNSRFSFEMNFKNFSSILLEIIENDNIIARSVILGDKSKDIIRYGFLSDYKKTDNTNDDIIWMLCQHINYIQFYDWSKSHSDMVSKEIDYKDMMGKENNINIIKSKISESKKHGIKSIAYGPIYASDKNYYELHKEEAYYSTKDNPLKFIDTFYFMNLTLKSNWVNHISSQYNKAINLLGFDGIHMDTYGYPKRALDYEGNICLLEDQIPAFIDKVIEKTNPNSDMIFNNVGNWPVKSLLNSKLRAVYIEVWPPYNSFVDLKNIILNTLEGNKPIIIAAYIASFRLDRKNALYSAILTTLTINFNGASHLFLGEDSGVLTQGYYCDYEVLTNIEKNKILLYQDFFAIYQDLLYDKSLKDVTLTYCGGENEEYKVKGNYSLSGEAGKVWVNFRTNGYKHLITLINLIGNDNFWNKGKIKPIISTGLEFSIQVFGKINKIYFADPEQNFGKNIDVPFSRTTNDRGDVIHFNIDKIIAGAIVWFEEI